MSNKYVRHGEVQAVRLTSMDDIGKVLALVFEVCGSFRDDMTYADARINCLEPPSLVLEYRFDGYRFLEIINIGSWLVYDPNLPVDDDHPLFSEVSDDEFTRIYKNA